MINFPKNSKVLNFTFKEVKLFKHSIRERIWSKLENEKVSLFPGAWGRIPNFKGAEECFKFLENLNIWKEAKYIKINPDSPQKYFRLKALEEGKIVYMAVPKLSKEKCFIELDPSKIYNFKEASTIKGAFKWGKMIFPWQIKRIDLIIIGSVAVNIFGQRIGKGGGYAELEYAILKEFGKIDKNVKIITNVHPLQIIKEEFPMMPYDLIVDIIITPEKIIFIKNKYKKPQKIFWEFLDDNKINSIPILQKIKESKYKSKHLVSRDK